MVGISTTYIPSKFEENHKFLEKKDENLDQGDTQTDGQSDGQNDHLRKIPINCRLTVPNLKLIGCTAIIYMYHIHHVYSTCMLKCALSGHLEFLKIHKKSKSQ